MSVLAVSIHAPRAGSDAVITLSRAGDAHRFNPRSPRGERRVTPTSLGDTIKIVSIHAPARGATVRSSPARIHSCVVSIHAPARGATALSRTHAATALPVSIHAPRAGSDTTSRFRRAAMHSVSIHAPARGATSSRDTGPQLVSIHAPRAGSDPSSAPSTLPFQSTLPARAATGPAVSSSSKWAIQHGSAYVPKNAA